MVGKTVKAFCRSIRGAEKFLWKTNIGLRPAIRWWKLHSKDWQQKWKPKP